MNTRSALRDGAAYLFLVLAMTFAQPSAATNTEWRVSADLSDPACMQSVPFLPSDSPAWFAGLWVQGGNLVAGTGWSPTNAAADSLILGVDRQSLTNDLALTAVWSSSSTGAAAEVNVRLFSASPQALTTNICVRSGEPVALPFLSCTDAVFAVVQASSTNVAVLSLSLSVDNDLDGLDAGQEAEYGTSDALRDTDGDGYSDLYEILCGTLPTDASSHPTSDILLVVPADATVESPDGTGPDDLGYAEAYGNGFTPVLSWSDTEYEDLHTDLLAAFRLDGLQDGAVVGGYGMFCLTGTVHGAVSGTPGRVGGAFSFDGSGQYISLGAPDGLNAEPQYSPVPPGWPVPTNAYSYLSKSVSVWVRPLELSGCHNIIAHGYTLSPDAEFALRINEGRYEFQSWRGSAGEACVSAAVPSGDVGSWVHIVGVFDGVSWQLYRNGVLAARLDSNFPPPVSSAPWAIGATANGAERFFKGDIDDLCLWRRALSSNEVARIWQAGYDGIGAASLISGLGRTWTASPPSGGPSVSAVQAVRVVDRLPPSLQAPADISLPESENSGPSVAGVPSVYDRSDSSPLLFSTDFPVSYPASLALWYPFDETSGSVSAKEGLGRGHGTPVGTAALGAGGVSGNAASFDGSLGRIALGGCDALSSLTNSFTVAAWVRPSQLPSSVGYVLTAKSYGWAFGFRDGRLRFDLCSVASYETVVPAETGRWCHVAATYDVSGTNRTVSLYCNGTLVGAQSGCPAFRAASGGWFVGGAADLDRCFAGRVDDLAVWSSVLTPEAVSDLYQTGREGGSVAIVGEDGIAYRGILRRWAAVDHAAWYTSDAQWIYLSDLTAPQISAPPDFTASAPSPTVPDTTGWPSVSDNSDPAPAVVWRDTDNALSRGLRMRMQMYQPVMYDGWPSIIDFCDWYTVSGLGMHTVPVSDGLPPGASAVSFNGTTAIVTMGNPDHMNFSGAFTISVWMRPATADGVHNVFVHGYRVDPAAETGLRMNSGYYQLFSWNGTDHGVFSAIPAEDVGRWVHIVGTCDGSVWRLYRDGLPMALARDEFGAMEMSANWGIGGRTEGTDRLFKGDIREVCLWNRALIPGEVAELHRLEVAGGVVAHDVPLPNRGMALFLPLDSVQAGATVTDLSANALSPSVHGSPSVSGNGLTFNGYSDWVAIGNPTNLNFSGPFSVSAWVKPQTVYGVHNILSHGYRLGPNAEVCLRIYDGNCQFLSWDGNDHIVSAPVPSAYASGAAWLHVAGTFDGGTWRLYFNGSLAASAVETNSGAIPMDADWAVGAKGGGGERFFTGGIRSVGLWNRALAPDDILRLMSATQSTSDPGFGAVNDRIIERTWTATDRAGNSASATQSVTVHLALAADADGDGLYDIEEEFSGSDPSKTDTDGDGLSDYEEVVVLGTDPLKIDTDGDGIPDKWEVDNGTDPLVFDSLDDPDRDGLCNYDEWQAGTDPLNPDSDGDGMTDGTEVLAAFSDPLAVDFNGTRTYVGSAVSGASFAASTGGWVVENGSACARERCGSLVYDLSVPSPSPHALAVTVTQWNRYTARDSFDLSLEADGLSCGRITVYAAYGQQAEAVFFLPPMSATNHTFRLVWRNNAANTFLEVVSLAFVSFGGPDADSNGEPDWSDNRSANIWQTGPVPEYSLVSPICIEGAGRFSQAVSVVVSNSVAQTVGGVSAGVGDRWFTDVGLDPSGETAVALDGLENGGSAAFSVGWEVFSLSEPVTNAVVLREGDSLLLGVSTNTDVAVTLDGQGVTNFTVSAGVPVPFAFAVPGDYLVSAVPEGDVSGVQVAIRAFPRELLNDSYAVLIGKRYAIACPEVPPGLVIEHDERLNVDFSEEGNGSNTVSVLTYSDKRQGVVIRLEDGPVLDAASVIPVYADNGGYWQAVRVYPDGSRLVEGALRLGAVPEGLTVVLRIFVSGVTFEDGTLEKTLTAADFDADGVCRYRLLQSADCATSVCHTTTFYQNGVLIGGN